MAAVDAEWEDVPSYFDLCRGIYEFLEKTYRESFVAKEEPHTVELSWHYNNFSTYDICFVVLLAIAWTILRHFATEWIFKVSIMCFYVM